MAKMRVCFARWLLFLSISITILDCHNRFVQATEHSSEEDFAWRALPDDIDFPSSHWERVLRSGEIREWLNLDSWNVDDAELSNKIKEFIETHGEALAAYQKLQNSSDDARQRHLLQTDSDASMDDWLSTWTSSLRDLVENMTQGQSTSREDVKTILEEAFSQTASNGPSMEQLQELLQRIVAELSFEQKGTEARSDIDVWTRLEQGMDDVQDLQRRAALARALLSAFQGYEACRSSVGPTSTLDCFNDLVDDLEGVVAEFDAHVYEAQSGESDDVLDAFRRDMGDSISSFQTCHAMQDYKRIPCLAGWWKTVLEMQQRYANFDPSSLSTADARLVALLQQMLSIESYLPGSDPTITINLPFEAPPAPLSEVIQQALTRSAEDSESGPVETVRRIVLKLKAFVKRIGGFARLRKDGGDAVGVKRKLLSDDRAADWLDDYLLELDHLAHSLSTMLARRTELGDTIGEDRIVEAFQFLFQSTAALSGTGDETQSTRRREFRERLGELMHQKIAGEKRSDLDARLREMIQTQLGFSSRKLLMAPGQQGQYTLTAPSEDSKGKGDLSELRRIFEDKATNSLKRLGEVKSLTTRRLSQVDPSGKLDFLREVRPQLKSLVESLEDPRQDEAALKEAVREWEEQLRKRESKNPKNKAAADLLRKTVRQPESRLGQADKELTEGNMLEALLRSYLGRGWKRVVADADADMQRVLRSVLSIVAHDLHYHSNKDLGLLSDRIRLEQLPHGSDIVLSRVGGAVKALSELKVAARDSTPSPKRHAQKKKDAKAKRSLLEASPTQSATPMSGLPFEGTAERSQGPIYQLSADVVGEETFYLEDGQEADYIPLTEDDFSSAAISPYLPEMAEAKGMDQPRWWIGQTLAVPDDHAFEYAYDFGTFDEEAPVEKALGSFLKYHILKDLKQEQALEEQQRLLTLKFVLLFTGACLGAFLAFLSLGIYLLRKELDKQHLSDDAYLDETESPTVPLATKATTLPISYGGLKIKTGNAMS